MKRRVLGATGVELSPLTFGSMRLGERDLDDAAWLELLAEARARGITTLHSSTEYASHARFCSLLGRLEGPHEHIVKLAEPHFGDDRFDPARLVAKVDEYLAQLGAARLDVVQWMWRGDLKDEPARLAGAAAQLGEIAEAFAGLRRAGKIGAVATFPYTVAFGELVVEARLDGITVYLNDLEREMVPLVERAADLGLGAVTIRPLCAGKTLAARTAGDSLRAVLAQRGVATSVVTFSSSTHLRELAAAADHS